MPQDNSHMDTGALPKLHLEIKDNKHDSLNLLHGGSGGIGDVLYEAPTS